MYVKKKAKFCFLFFNFDKQYKKSYNHYDMIKKPTKVVCPRCKEKYKVGTQKCEICGLVFARLKYATNSAAKNMIKHGQGKKVIYTSDIPKDVSWVKMFTFSLLLGIFGAHNFYIGRYKKAISMLVMGVITIIGFALSLNSLLNGGLNIVVSIIVGVNAILWILDTGTICMRKYKIPVYIDLEELK